MGQQSKTELYLHDIAISLKSIAKDVKLNQEVRPRVMISNDFMNPPEFDNDIKALRTKPEPPKKKKKVFISGPMSGYPDLNRPSFLQAEKELVASGYSVFNPAWLLVDETWERSDLMAIDTAALSHCDFIYQLEGWQNSDGARLEQVYAEYTGIPFLFKEEYGFIVKS